MARASFCRGTMPEIPQPKRSTGWGCLAWTVIFAFFLGIYFVKQVRQPQVNSRAAQAAIHPGMTVSEVESVLGLGGRHFCFYQLEKDGRWNSVSRAMSQSSGLR